MFDKVILETIKDFEGSSETSPLRKYRWHAEPTETGADDPNRWFSVTMGTGIVSILLHNLPYNANWLYWLCCVFRRQCSSLRHLHLHICYKIYDVPRNLGCYDSASDAVFISGNLPYGLCNHRQHGGLCLCAILGTVGHNLGVDYVVD
jgi:hypothetical protein